MSTLEGQITDRSEYSTIGTLLKSERIPKPNTLPKQEAFSSIREGLDGTETVTTTTGNTATSGSGSGKPVTTTKGNTATTAATIPNTTTKGNTTAAAASSSTSTTDYFGNLFNISTKNPIGEGFVTEVIEAAHLYILLWFVAVYLLVFYIFGFFLKQNERTYVDYAYSLVSGSSIINKTLTGTFDFIMYASLVLYLVYLYLTADAYTRLNLIPAMWDWSWNWFSDSVNLWGLILFTLVFYLLVYALGVPMSKELRSSFVHLIDAKIWSILASFLILYVFKYVFGIDIPAYFLGKNFITDLWGGGRSKKVAPPSPLPLVKGNVYGGNTVARNEVFNIANNLYSYDDAQLICSAYGARLANYDEIEDAYNTGGEWCNYGWSEGQMIFFPTQKSTWDTLQKDPKKKNTCGRPGVNGGYMQNPYLRFGVNCYGKKPKPSDADLAKMNNKVVAKTPEELELEKKVQFWKDNSDKLLKLNAFNNKNWSQY